MPKSGTPQAFLGMLLYLTCLSSSLAVTQLLVRLSCFSKLPVAVHVPPEMLENL